MDAERIRGAMQVKNELVHAYPAGHTVQTRAFSGHHTHRAASLDHMLGTFHIEAGSGTVDAVRIPDWYDRRGSVGRGQIGAAIGDAMSRLDILDGAELRLQGHGRLQTIRAGRAHGRIRLVTVQADARTGQLEMDFRTAQRGGGIGKMTNLRGDAGRFHTAGEILEILNLTVGGGYEFRHVRRVRDSQMAPLADDMQHALLDERHQLGECRVETGRSESVTSETGIDLHMHTGGLAETTRGLGHAVDTTKRTDGNVDIVGNQLIERHRGAVVDPCQNMAAVQADTGLA